MTRPLRGLGLGQVVDPVGRSAASAGRRGGVHLGLAPARRVRDPAVGTCSRHPGPPPRPLVGRPSQPSPDCLPVSGRPSGDDAELVLVIDQFEETFTHCTDPAERIAFIAALVRSAQAPRQPLPRRHRHPRRLLRPLHPPPRPGPGPARRQRQLGTARSGCGTSGAAARSRTVLPCADTDRPSSRWLQPGRTHSRLRQ